MTVEWRSVTGQPTVLHEFFERSADRWPDAIAVDVPPGPGRPRRRQLSYRELRWRSDDLVSAILAADNGDGAPVVAVFLPRTTEDVYASQLAVLKAGYGFVCVDPAFPDEQVGYILRDARAAILLTDAQGAERARRTGYQGAVVRLDRPLRPPAVSLAPPPPPPADSLAYVIYTSGTTGRPKGVMIGHRSIANLVGSDVTEFGLGPGDRVAQGSSAAYDSSVEEVWLAWASGATVVVLDDDAARLGPDLVPWLRHERITVLCPPPTLLRTTGCADPRTELPDLRLLYVGGEALTADVVERWAPGRRMVNGYGPTECTVTCVRGDVVAGAPITVGRPVPGMRAWVLDENLTPVRDGEPGELCMAGAGVALGYLNQPELTAAKFPTLPLLGRVYRTGDLVSAGPDGTLFYHGRIDSQVKLRGYRIELEAIEAHLARCPGVREAACCVQGEGAAQTLVAFVVAADPGRPPDPDALKAQLQRSLPVYMVPSLFGTIEELPRGASGKVRRNDLPVLTAGRRQRSATAAGPSEPVEQLILRAVEEAVATGGASVDDDFFNDLGGSSLQAAIVISALRADPRTEAITVRDLYEARTVRALARRATSSPSDARAAQVVAARPRRPVGDPARVTLAQSVWLLLELLILAPLGYLTVFRILPLLSEYIGLVPLIVVVPVLLAPLSTLWTPISISIVAQLKKLLIGRYEPTRVPVWSDLYVRMWIMRQVVRIVPWRSIAGTEFQCMALRALGARIGRRVHIHRGVNLLSGGWDLLEIGDDVTLSQDASIGLVTLSDGHVVVGPVTIADGATLDVRAGVGPYTRVGRNAWLAALSSLPASGTIPDGERWDGVPARPVGPAPAPPTVTARGSYLSPVLHGIAMIVAGNLLRTVLAVPFLLVTILFVRWFNLTYDSLLAALTHPMSHLGMLGTAAALACVGLVGEVALEAIAARAIGTVRPGVISRWSPSYIRVWLKAGLVDSAGHWLSGGLFWPTWLRWAGMKVGRGCEISTIIDVVPELNRIGGDTFFADGIYLGGPRVHRGTVALGRTRLSRNTFLGNHAVIAGGQWLPEDILIGICTVADDRVVRPGTSWFGHPPFELPRREVVECDRRLTHNPPLIRRVNRLFWEWLRFALPVVPLLFLVAWVAAMARAEAAMPLEVLFAVGAAAVSLATAVLPCLFVLALKWILLGRVRPGTHPLWSCWASRWDFLYVAWGFIASGVLASLEGTLLLAVYLRAMGMKIGKRVVLSEGFAQVVDPDMLHIDDDATVNAMFQAHTFEDRVLKIAQVRVGAGSTLADGTVPLYGADIGMGTYVAPHSVIMKQERLLPGLRYEGAPCRREQQPAQR
ncbi:amino acid adenylation domain-containing protein [Planosporangium thailandense]|uniref:Amino acid adenylation domain-containing protein n=1 Tax=Planosporangium thailandense TaxID=765197 RepID=A0ABX0Y1U0_9ACTN|nr:non-ribosomal peptide synthetase [Planosporangium thailandense]NJC72329.1 amino acid adenylation domain-containing protein [Planosporangium thailandense]